MSDRELVEEKLSDEIFQQIVDSQSVEYGKLVVEIEVAGGKYKRSKITKTTYHIPAK